MTIDKKNGVLFVISGPSGVGKGTIIKELLGIHSNLALSVSATTRQPRINETNGESYHFLSQKKFKDYISQDQFLEWCIVHNQYYGTLKSEISQKLDIHEGIIIEIDVQGAQKLRHHNINQYHIFISPPDIETLKKRLNKRNTENHEILEQRLKTALTEMDSSHLYDKVIINDQLTQTINSLHNIISEILTKGVNQ